MINSLFGTVFFSFSFFLLFFFFQDKEKEQGLGSKAVRSKELLPKNSAKVKGNGGKYPISLAAVAMVIIQMCIAEIC